MKNSNQSKNAITSNKNDEDVFASNKFLFRENTKQELNIQKQKFDEVFKNITSNDNNQHNYKSQLSTNSNKKNDDFLFGNEVKPYETNKKISKNNFDDDFFGDKPKNDEFSRRPVAKKPSNTQKDDLLEELFGDDLFGGPASKKRMSPIGGARAKPNPYSNAKPSIASNKNNYEDIFGKPSFGNSNKKDSFLGDDKNAYENNFDYLDRNTPNHDKFNTRRSRYFPNSGKRESGIPMPNANPSALNKWNSSNQKPLNSGVRANGGNYGASNNSVANDRGNFEDILKFK